MKKWYLLLVIFSFSAPLIGMENSRDSNDGNYIFSAASSDQSNGETRIVIEDLIKQAVKKALTERDKEHEQHENSRFFGMNSWLKHHLWVITTVQIIGSIASTAGFIAYFFPYSC